MCAIVAGRLSGRFYTDKNRLSALAERHTSKKVKNQANVRVNNLSPYVKEALFMVKVGKLTPPSLCSMCLGHKVCNKGR